MGAETGGEAGTGAWAGAETAGELEAAAAAAGFAGGEPGAAAAAAVFAGDVGEALAWAWGEAEPGAGFVTDGALVIGGGLGTGGFVTEPALWTGLGF